MISPIGAVRDQHRAAGGPVTRGRRAPARHRPATGARSSPSWRWRWPWWRRSIAALATLLGKPTHPAPAPLTPPTTGPPRRPPHHLQASTTTTLSAQALPQGQALTALLAQSSGTSRCKLATQAIAACGDLAQAQATLSGAQAARQSLLQPARPARPRGAAPVRRADQLPRRRLAEAPPTRDASDAQWAADEQAKPVCCQPTGNGNYQAALAADGRASTAKKNSSPRRTRWPGLWGCSSGSPLNSESAGVPSRRPRPAGRRPPVRWRGDPPCAVDRHRPPPERVRNRGRSSFRHRLPGDSTFLTGWIPVI